MSAALKRISERTGVRVVLGILSWKSDVTFERSLADHAARGLFALFDETVVHFQEVRDADIQRAERYGIRWIGSDRNRHIGGGFYHLVKNVETDYFLLFEDDLTLAMPAADLGDLLADAVQLLRQGDADHLVLRRDDMVRSGYEKYFRLVDFDAGGVPAELGARNGGGPLGRWFRRARHPVQADKQLAKIVWFEREPEKVRPDVVRKVTIGRHDFYVVSGPATKWAHPGQLASRAHLLDVYGHVASNTPGFEDYGKCLEELVNDGPFRDWWLARNFRVAYAKPVATLHNRLQDGGKVMLKGTPGA